MKKCIFLLFISLNISAQNLTVEEIELCTVSSFDENKEFLMKKGFVFLKDTRDMAQTLISVFQRIGKDTLVVGLVNNGVKVWGVELGFRSKTMFQNYKKAVMSKGYKLDKKTMNSDLGEEYEKGKALFVLGYIPYGGFLGPHYQVDFIKHSE